MCPVFLLVAAALVGVARGALSQCWEHSSCQEVTSESSLMECLQLCRSLTNETPLIPGEAHLQALPPSDLLAPPSSSSPQAKRSYSMEHFRWGKPVGRKRRPIKIYSTNGVEEESNELFPTEMRRREATGEEQEASPGEELVGEGQEVFPTDFQEKKDNTYKMKHFRWSGPAASKRYGGFMKSYEERSQRPLLTLFRNVINKDGQERKRREEAFLSDTQ